MRKASEPNLKLVPIDLPGFGQATESTAFSVSAMADFVADKIRSHIEPPWGLIGHSMGAKVATVLAARIHSKPLSLDGLATLILLAGSPPSPEPMNDGQRATLLSWFRSDHDASLIEARLYIEQNITHPLTPESHAQAIEDLERMNRAAWSAWLDSGSREDWSDRVGVIDTPALLIAGANDKNLGVASQKQWMAPHFSNAELHVLDETTHLIPLEAPMRAAQMIWRHAAAL